MISFSIKFIYRVSNLLMRLDVTNNYVPSETEEYMCEKHLEYFKRKLQDWKQEIISNSKLTLESLQEKNTFPDDTDRASNETDRSVELRSRDRQRKLISKIDKALKSIDEGEYGFCEETGDPIGLARLEARPTATLSVEAQERHERNEKIYRFK